MNETDHRPVVASRCIDCGDVRFPARGWCASCGSEQIEALPVEKGTVEAVTQTTSGPMARVRLAVGPVVVGPVADAVPPGTAVTATTCDGLTVWRRDP